MVFPCEAGQPQAEGDTPFDLLWLEVGDRVPFLDPAQAGGRSGGEQQSLAE